jgi:3-oxoacyl-[acyl-carrier-protein] synthase-1
VDAKGEPLRGAFDPLLGVDEPCLARVLALGEHCLEGLAERLGKRDELALPVVLALPEHRPGWTKDHEKAVEKRLDRRFGAIVPQTVRTVARGHAGGLKALQVATQLVDSGMDACVVGGIESYFDPATLAWLGDNRQLMQPDARSAFFPGEAACFMLIMHRAAQVGFGLPALAAIRSVGIAEERCRIKTDEDNLGDGLVAAVREAAGGFTAAGQLVDDVFSDINGERYRAEEWGMAILRTSTWFRDPSAYIAPAGQWGDVGAASGTLLSMLATAGWNRGYARGPLAMVIAGSEGGLRGAALLEHVPPR